MVVLLIVTGIVVLGAGIGVRYFTENSGKSSSDEPNLSATKNQEPALIPQVPATETLAPSSEFNSCENIVEEGAKNLCYTELAAVMKDRAPCEKIQDQLFIYKCYTDVANAAKDLSICKKIQNPSEKYKCYVNYRFFHQW